MNHIFRTAALAALLCLLALEAPARCQDGNTSSCRRNGCAGISECVDGRMLGCEILGRCVVPPPKDRIVADFVVPGQEVGILYDGADARGAFNDRSVIVTPSATTATALVPNVLTPALGNSLIAFSRSRQPRLWPASWTTSTDTLHVPMDNNIRVNVTFWILAGDFATQQTNAAAAVLAVNNAYAVEKAGIRIAFVTVNNATTNPAAAALLTGGSRQQFMTGIGFNPGEINVYVINTVNGGATSGVNFDGTPVILLGQYALTFPQLLEHEMGHAFVLGHVAGAPGFNFENVMWPSVAAHFLTEGQIFRMHFHPSSQLNVFNLRPTQRQIICDEPATNDCPANNRRLWQDGSLPPN